VRLPGLGSFNAFLIACHAAPSWGQQSLKSLLSLFVGFEDRAHATASIFFQHLLDLPFDGLLRISATLAGFRLVVAVGFLAYLIDFARACVMEREPDRATLDLVLLLALATTLLSLFPALALGDGDTLHRQASYLLLLTGALTVLAVERRMERSIDAEPQPAALPASLSTSPASLNA
jgi:hypothetical protein